MPEDRTGERRETVVPPYRVTYRIDGETVFILSVIHGARRITELPDA
jgi:hypothetical protein